MKNNTYRGFPFWVAAFTLSLLIVANSHPQKVSGEVSTDSGLIYVTYALPQGKVKIYLPDDMAAGDTITGTVTTEPSGRTEDEKAANNGVLNGLVIDLGDGQQRPVQNPRFRWTTGMSPAVKKMFDWAPKLIDASGKTVARANVQIPSQPPSAATTFQLPKFAQTGRPIEISGPFDGDAANTKCTLELEYPGIMAESPRKLIIMSPKDKFGVMDVRLTEGPQTHNGQIRNLSVSLSSPKTNLTKGETTNVYLEIRGLEGESERVPLQLVTSGSANMNGGNLQKIDITPNMIAADGVFRQTFTLTGTRTGGFTVNGTIQTGNPVAGNQCKCVCELGKTPIVTAGKSKIDGGGMQHAFKANVAKAACNGSKCSIEKTEYSWSIGARSTATYTVAGAKQDGEALKLDVTGSGTVILTVTVTITCSDGTKCSASGTSTFTVEAK